MVRVPNTQATHRSRAAWMTFAPREKFVAFMGRVSSAYSFSKPKFVPGRLPQSNSKFVDRSI
jgi:hypothetical protein